MVYEWERVAALFRKALLHGAERASATRCIWRMSADCENPFYREMVGRPSPLDGGKTWEWTPGRRATLRVEMYTRCNKCERCARYRRWLWINRINYEIQNAPRTWYGTLTLAPLWHLRCEVQARKEGKSPLAVSGLEVTRYMKRLRKHAKGKLRFVCVTEPHKSGKPHYHLLVHEQTRGALTHSVLAKHWTWGFERWRVVDPQRRPAWYLCKYLTKQNEDRVRASILYGGRQKDHQGHL